MKKRTYQFGKSTLTLEFGDITTSSADVIVSSDDAYISMGGGVSAGILRAGGQEIMIDAAKKVPANAGDVIVTTAGRLHAQYVFHVITIGSGSEKVESHTVLRKTVSRCFDLLDVLDLHSIAFPAIGAGAAGFSYEDVAVEMANIVASRLTASERFLDVTVFLYDRFGRMQEIDFIRFFEEFRARVPDIAAHVVLAGVEKDASAGAPKVVEKPAEPIARRHDMRTALNQLTEERSLLEDQLARMAGSGDNEEMQRKRERLNEIQDEWINILTKLQSTSDQAVYVFTSYAHEDQELLAQLMEQLSPLKRLGVIREWHDHEITAGTEWRGQIDSNLETAQLILLLISPAFMKSDYCYDVEAKRALQRHEAGDARVIPVILRPAMWQITPFSKLQALPREGRPVTEWENRDSALLNVVEGIKAAIESLAVKGRSTGT